LFLLFVLVRGDTLIQWVTIHLSLSLALFVSSSTKLKALIHSDTKGRSGLIWCFKT